jgi:hypothetical protein
MQLDHLPGNVHLTYCTNIHAGETWDEVRRSLETHLHDIKAQVSPNAPFGIGLRLSAIAAEALSAPETLAAFREYLFRHDFYVFTINAFPYGPFHGRRVKEDVYQPDWLTPERLAYTNRAAERAACHGGPNGSTCRKPRQTEAAERPGDRARARAGAVLFSRDDRGDPWFFPRPSTHKGKRFNRRT